MTTTNSSSCTASHSDIAKFPTISGFPCDDGVRGHGLSLRHLLERRIDKHAANLTCALLSRPSDSPLRSFAATLLLTATTCLQKLRPAVSSVLLPKRLSSSSSPRSSPCTTRANSSISAISGFSLTAKNTEDVSSSTAAVPAASAARSWEDCDPNESLACLQYEMQRHIALGRLPQLDINVMHKLCAALLLAMKDRESGGLLHLRQPRYSSMSAQAFSLFGQFIAEVATFRKAVATVPLPDLNLSLDLGGRLAQYSVAAAAAAAAAAAVIGDGGTADALGGTPQGTAAVLAVTHLVLCCFPPAHGTKWEDLVSSKHRARFARELLAYAPPSTATTAAVAFADDEKQQDVVIGDLEYHSSYVRPLECFPPPSLYHDHTIDELVDIFGVNVAMGLTVRQVEARTKAYGQNVLPKPKPVSVLRIIWGQLTDFMVLMLFAAIVATAVDKDWKSSIVLAMVIVINTVVGSSQEIKAGRAISALESLAVQEAQVLRDGELQSINAAELVPGDIVCLSDGDRVPADIRLIECSYFEVVESLLTGESEPVYKNPAPILDPDHALALGECTGNAFMSSIVSRGSARGIVVRTGVKTEIGKISIAVNGTSSQRGGSVTSSKKTPIQRHLKKLGLWLIILALGLCAAIVIIGVAWGRKFVPMFISGLSLAVSVVPEGLVAVTTITMAFGVRRMARRRAIVRVLPAVETLGSVTVICSDKTGTLTEGKMCPSSLTDASGHEFEFVDAAALDPAVGSVARKDGRGLTTSAYASLFACLHCNNSNITRDCDTGEWTSVGDPTEVALMSAAQKGHISGDDGWVRVAENPFDSERKMMSTVHTHVGLERDGKVLMLVKGAPEEILAKCTRMCPNFDESYDDSNSGSGAAALLLSRASGNAGSLAGHDLDAINARCGNLAGRGLRVLGLAFKLVDKPAEADSGKLENNNSGNDCSGSSEEASQPQQVAAAFRIANVESDLIFAGLVAVRDPIREGVKDAIKSCHQAGIRVIMITGDNVKTASAIASELGILDPCNASMGRVATGSDIAALTNAGLANLAPFPVVFARVSPSHKLGIVDALQSKGHQVLMTGDGVNDAPAIKRADVGVAMGQHGSDITKQVAEVVLADNNFTTIVEAIKEGRHIFDNILKFIVYLLSCNTGEIMLFLMSTLINVDMPFTVIMILWANIIADVPPALSLGMEPPERRIMHRPPRHPKQGVINRVSAVVILLQAFFMAVATFAAYFVFDILPIADHLTMKHIVMDPDYKPSLFHQGTNLDNNDGNPNDRVAAARSLAFGVLTILQLNQAFLSRSITDSVFKTGIISNPWMLAGVSLSFGLYVMGSYIPGWRDWLNLVPLAWPSWIIMVGLVVVQVAFSELLKLAVRSWYRKHPIYGTLEVVGVPDSMAPKPQGSEL